MWPFSSQPSNSALEERIKRLERDFLALQEEWDDAFDRIRRAENRISKKRASLPVEEVPLEESGGGRSGALDSPNGTVASPFLTPRQKQIQQMILRRRAGAA